MIGKKTEQQVANPLLDLPPIVERDVDTHNLPSPRAGLFFSMVDFAQEIRRFDTMDVMTYSCFELDGRPRVERLIHCRETSYKFVNVGERRVGGNIHAKIYICRDKRLNPQAYIGSANWMPRNDFVEIMIRVNKQQTRAIIRFFNKLWRQLEKK